MKTINQIKSLVADEQWDKLTTPLEQALGLYYSPGTEAQGEVALQNLTLPEVAAEISAETLWVIHQKVNWDNLESLATVAKIARQEDNEYLLMVAAENFARTAHRSINHKRKYTGEEYFVHLKEVQEIVASVGGSFAQQSAGLLHDVVEDVKVDPQLILEVFGREITQLVEMLTDVSKPEDGNRKIRKHKDLLHTAQASPEAKTIKLADLISNSRSIIAHDPGFAVVYMREKRNLLAVLKEGDPTLYRQAQEIISQYYK
jgi:hypothetical protein